MANQAAEETTKSPEAGEGTPALLVASQHTPARPNNHSSSSSSSSAMEIQAAEETKSLETGEGTPAHCLRVPEVVHCEQVRIWQSVLARLTRSMKRGGADNLLEPKRASNFREFLSIYVLESAADWYGTILVSCCFFLLYEAKRYLAPLDFQTGLADADKTESLSIGLAFWASSVEIGHIALFLLGYALTLSLVLQIHARLVFFLLAFMVATPCFYFAGLFHQASASLVYVSVGSFFHIRIFWFMISTALGVCLVWSLLMLMGLYLLWTFRYQHMQEEGIDLKPADFVNICFGCVI